MKTIEFYPTDRETETNIPAPKPAKDYLPQWYKDTKIFDGVGPKFENGVISNKTVKSCIPFFDAYASGYIQETWCDIYVSAKDEYSFQYQFANTPPIVSHVERNSIKVSDEFLKIEFRWNTYWIPKLPKEYSLLFTHPLNRIDLPFTSVSGIIDSDYFYHSPYGNYPFYIKRGFEGIIPAGTPMFQMIPIKRESWQSKVMPLDERERDIRAAQTSKVFIGSYKRFFHKKKNYK
jgi:hypothetical protein